MCGARHSYIKYLSREEKKKESEGSRLESCISRSVQEKLLSQEKNRSALWHQEWSVLRSRLLLVHRGAGWTCWWVTLLHLFSDLIHPLQPPTGVYRFLFWIRCLPFRSLSYRPINDQTRSQTSLGRHLLMAAVTWSEQVSWMTSVPLCDSRAGLCLKFWQ